MIERKIFYHMPDDDQPGERTVLQGYEDWRVIGFEVLVIADRIFEIYLLEKEEYTPDFGVDTAFVDTYAEYMGGGDVQES